MSITIRNSSALAVMILGLVLAAAAAAQEHPTARPAKQRVTKPPKASWNPIERARAAARRTQSANNLKQFVLALNMYHDQHGRLPAAYIADKEGKPLLS